MEQGRLLNLRNTQFFELIYTVILGKNGLLIRDSRIIIGTLDRSLYVSDFRHIPDLVIKLLILRLYVHGEQRLVDDFIGQRIDLLLLCAGYRTDKAVE